MDLSCQCGKKFRSMIAEAKHRHNFPAMCRPQYKWIIVNQFWTPVAPALARNKKSDAIKAFLSLKDHAHKWQYYRKMFGYNCIKVRKN